MKFFEHHVDRRSRSAMTGFLRWHFRYSTMNGWNRMSSYANNIKVHRMGLPDHLLNAAFEALDADYWYQIDQPIRDFTEECGDNYTISSNGRSGGYLVLYDCWREKTGHLSFCDGCGQRNFKKVPPMYTDPIEQRIASVILQKTHRNAWTAKTYLSDPGIAELSMSEQDKVIMITRLIRELADCSTGDQCGVCGNPRTNYIVPPSQFVVSYRSIDQSDAFDPEEWSMSRLRDRVDLVCRFDKACDQIRANFIRLLENNEVVEETVYRPEKIKRLRKKAA